MIRIEAETHCHTIASYHAYSTVMENVYFAKEAGLKGIALTDHAQGMFDGAPSYFFSCLNLIPSELFGIKVYRGVELNILDRYGQVDPFGEKVFGKLDFVIASIHTPNFKPEDRDSVNKAYEGVADNPYVDVIGHCGRGRYFFDQERIIKLWKEAGKMVEFNEHSFDSGEESARRCLEIAKLCKKYEVMATVGSDAHFATAVGRYSRVLQMLEEIDFPQKLILNSDIERFDDYIRVRKARLKK